MTAANKVLPSITYDSSRLGLNGFESSYWINCENGLYVAVSNLGSGEVVVFWHERYDMPMTAIR